MLCRLHDDVDAELDEVEIQILTMEVALRSNAALIVHAAMTRSLGQDGLKRPDSRRM